MTPLRRLTPSVTLALCCGVSVSCSGGGDDDDERAAPEDPVRVQRDKDTIVVDELWRLLNSVTNGAPWYVAGNVDSGGACPSGSYTVGGRITKSGSSYYLGLEYGLRRCSLGSGFLNYDGSVAKSGNVEGSSNTFSLSSDGLSVTGTEAGTNYEGYGDCGLEANVTKSNGFFRESGTLCNRSFAAESASSSGGGGAGGDCTVQCPSTCQGNVPEQACLYCQAACLCACAKDSCEAANRQSALMLGTTCP